MKYCLFYTLLILVSLSCNIKSTQHVKYIDSTVLKNDTLQDYQILSNRDNHYDFGYSCYYSGRTPLGRIAINNLIKNEAYTSILSVLDGNNNEGKVYAVEALLVLSLEKKIELNQAAIDQIKSFIESDLEISQCDGCLVGKTKTRMLFIEYDFKMLLKKNQITIEKD